MNAEELKRFDELNNKDLDELSDEEFKELNELAEKYDRASEIEEETLAQAVSTGSLGNTKTNEPQKVTPKVTPNIRSRKWLITGWEKETKPIELLRNSQQYLISCDDVAPKTNKYHWHAFLYFNNPVRMSTLKKAYGDTIHVEIPQSISGAITYIDGTNKMYTMKGKKCNKTNIIEVGQQPRDNGCHYTIKELAAMGMKEAENLDSDFIFKWEKCRALFGPGFDINSWHKDVEVIYIEGPSGCGKTEMVKAIVNNKARNGEIPNTMVSECKHVDKFYLGLENTHTLIYDDFRDSHMSAAEFINFIDYNTHQMNIKGGKIVNTYGLILITSIQPLTDLYRGVQNQEPRKQWLRRIKRICLDENGKITKPKEDARDVAEQLDKEWDEEPF